MVTLKDRLRKFDGQNSVSNEFRTYTIQGAVLSVTTVILIVYLVSTEVYYNFKVTRTESVHVNATSSRGLEIEFDITLPHVQCNKLSIDANDVHGQSQSLHLDQYHHIWKHRIKMSDDGMGKQFIGMKQKLELGSALLTEKDLIFVAEDRKLIEDNSTTASNDSDITGNEDTKQQQICGSCYGAGEEGECCDTCEDVKRVYKRRGWVLRDVHTIQVCADEEAAEAKSSMADQTGEGCNVHGKVALSTGGGNLHLAPTRDVPTTGLSIIDILLQSFQEWNVSHTIHKVRFGPEIPNSATYQLDDETRVIADTFGMYQYYFQIVPTTYKYFNGTVLHTNQFSVVEHLRHIQPGSNRGLPGVFLFYDVSPLHVTIEESYQSGWIAFFTSVCAIVGGTVTVMGLLDQFLFQLLQKDTAVGLMK
jgi:endoplasmic reticulum-Golgi intermediate compartment protein 3